MLASRNVSEFDKARGIIGYLADVVPCKACNRLTNLLWDSAVGSIKACSAECAAKYEEYMR